MTREEKIAAISKMTSKLEKSFGKGSVMLLGEKPNQDIESISTGSIGLDIALGVGGLPKGRVVEIYGPESSGKCYSLDSQILTKDGYKSAEDIFVLNGLLPSCVTKEVPMEYPLINKDGEVEMTTHFTFNGRRVVYETITKTGFVHKTTAKHPLMVLSSTGQLVWKWTSEIEVGDYLVNINKPHFGSKVFDLDTMYAVGLLLADGCFSKPISITNNDPDICEFIENKMCSAIDASSIVVASRNENSIDYRINTGSPSSWCEKWGVERGVAKDKRIPKWVFESNKDGLSAFLRGFVDAESYIGRGGIEIASASYEMLYQLKLILSQFNISSSLLKQSWETKGYEDVDYWRLCLYEEDVEKYYDEVGTNSELRERQFSTFFENKSLRYNDSIPHIKPIVLDFCKTLRRSAELMKLTTDLYSKNIDVTRARLIDILSYAAKNNEHDNSNVFNQLSLLLNYSYDEVISKVKKEPEPTFDFAMEKTHSFIADGCINHNTTLCIHVMAEAQKLDGFVGIIDVEHAFDKQYASNLGVNVDQLYFSQPSTGEEALEILDSLLETKSFDVLVLDSVAALVPKAELDGEMGDSKIGLQARMMSQAMRKITAKVKASNTLVIFTNQLREKIGVMFGCFSYDSRVVFADGTTERIGKVVNQKINKPVLSMNPKTGEVVEAKILNWYKNGKMEDEWLQFVVDKGAGNGRSQFKVTENHLIFTDRGEISAGELRVGDTVNRLEKRLLNEDQKQIVLGSMIGDGHMKMSKRHYGGEDGDCAPTLAIHHSSNLQHQADYCKWKHSLFGEVANSYNKEKASFTTKPLAEFRNYDRKRVVEEIDLRGLAIMYMDDGSYNARTPSQGGMCFIYKRWPQEDLELLHDRIKDLTGAYGSVSEKFGRITYCTAQMRMFQDAIRPYMFESMKYKVRDLEVGGYLWDTNQTESLEVGQGLIRSIEKVLPKNPSQSQKFDLEIEGTHCYCVDGVFVHNSPEVTSGGNALKYYSSVRLDIRRSTQIKDGGQSTGSKTRVKVVKNKVAPPFTSAEFDIMFGKGISKAGEIVDYGVELDVIDKSGSWYSYGETRLGQGRDTVKQILVDNPELMEEVEAKIREQLK